MPVRFFCFNRHFGRHYVPSYRSCHRLSQRLSTAASRQIPLRDGQGGSHWRNRSHRAIHGVDEKVSNSLAPGFILRLFLSLAWLVVWVHMQSRGIRGGHHLQYPLADLEDASDDTSGVVGAVVAELERDQSNARVVIFGMARCSDFGPCSIIRNFTGKQSCRGSGLRAAWDRGQWRIRYRFSWILVYWLDSHSSCRSEFDSTTERIPKPVLARAIAARVHKCRLQSSRSIEERADGVSALYPERS